METGVVTGAAGFIGFHVARRLSADGYAVVGINNFDPYYDPGLKRSRVAALATCANFRFAEADFADRGAVARLFAADRFAYVVHLGAQAGVRYSIDHPHEFAGSNVTGFLNVLEGARRAACRICCMRRQAQFTEARLRRPAAP